MEKEISDVRQYFRNFRVSRLTSCEKNKEIIEGFSALERGNELERYLKEDAWDADSKGETCVYLVFDKKSQLAAFFSLKCGLLYTKNSFDDIPDDDMVLFCYIVDALKKKDYDAVEEYTKDVDYRKAEKLVELAKTKVAISSAAKKNKEDEFSALVKACYSALELQYFCKNKNYAIQKYRGIPLGFGIFWETIVPKINEIIKIIGCKYLYLFAADQTNTKDIREQGRLIRYYNSNLNFKCSRELLSIKPNYDLGCVAMHQKVDDLLIARNDMWERFSDNIKSE